MQSRESRRIARASVMRFEPPCRSTVSTSTGQPAASTRRTSADGHGPLVGGVELVPDRLAACGAHVLDAGRRDRREDLQVFPRAGRFRARDLTVRVERTLASDRIQEDRRRPGRAEEADGRVDPGDVHQPPHAQAVVREARVVGAQRRVAVYPGLEIAPVSGRQLRAREPLEVEHVARVGGGRDERVVVAGACTERACETRRAPGR